MELHGNGRRLCFVDVSVCCRMLIDMDGWIDGWMYQFVVECRTCGDMW